MISNLLDILLHVFLLNFGFMGMFNMFVTFPIIFNIFIIPKIEKQIGCKLHFTQPYLRTMPKCIYRWAGSNVQVSSYIVLKYLMMKFTGKPSDQTKSLSKSAPALQNVNYRVESASWFTIFMSFVVIINALSWFLLGILKTMGYKTIF
jgi:hypothetical protein